METMPIGLDVAFKLPYISHSTRFHAFKEQLWILLSR